MARRKREAGEEPLSYIQFCVKKSESMKVKRLCFDLGISIQHFMTSLLSNQLKKLEEKNIWINDEDIKLK
jgi:hypothetical protein